MYYVYVVKRARKRSLKHYGQAKAHLEKRLLQSLQVGQISAGFNSGR